jgi:apolipoprotein N-acyltransferase
MRLIQGLLGFRPVTFFLEHFFPSSEERERFTTSCFWAVISAGVMCLAFPKFEMHCLAWIGLVPFLRQLYQCGPKQGFWIGLVFGWVFFYLNLLWLNQLYAFNPWIVAGVPIMALIFSFFGPALFGLLAALILPHRGWLRFFCVPALWTALEVLRAQTELAFPWLYLGHTQVNSPVMIQVCDLTGVAGVSFVIMLVNQALADSYRFILRKNETGAYRSIVPKWAVAVLSVLAVAGYGQWRLGLGGSSEPQASPEKPFRVAILQPAVEQQRKFASYAHDDPAVQVTIQKQMNEELLTQLKKARRSCETTSESLPGLYVLPESALTNDYFNLIPNLQEMVRQWAVAAGAPIFLGANRVAGTVVNDRLSDDARFYNSAYLVDPEKGVDVAGAYDKQRLVPFGEYAPFLGRIPGFQQYVLQLGSFSMGDTARIFQVGGKKFGCLICFESCFPSLMRKFEASDPDWMTIITNDAWYKLSSGPRRHQTQAIFRAVETRRPIVRAANTGISCVVDPWGRVLKSLPLNEEEPTQILATVPPRPAWIKGKQTFYMRHGEWFAWLCVAICGAALLRVFLHSRRAAASEEWNEEAPSTPSPASPSRSSKRPGKTQ